MNRFFTLVFAASCLTAVGQVNTIWNPDSDGDESIGVPDLMSLLSVYGLEVPPVECVQGDFCGPYTTAGAYHTLPTGCGVVICTRSSYNDTDGQLRLPSEGYLDGHKLKVVVNCGPGSSGYAPPYKFYRESGQEWTHFASLGGYPSNIDFATFKFTGGQWHVE